MTDKNLVAFCGLYCGDCANHNGEIADLARDLRKKLREEKFDKVADVLSPFFKEFKDYDQCYAVLGGMVKLRCKNGCHGFRGRTCGIGICCMKKALNGCWECGEFEDCKKFDFLKTIHGDANLKNLRVIKKKGVEAFINGKHYK
jgi:hypothetical protein